MILKKDNAFLYIKSVDASTNTRAGLAQGIRGTFFEHPLLVYNLGGLRPLGKHYQCYSGTVWCAVQRFIFLHFT